MRSDSSTLEQRLLQLEEKQDRVVEQLNELSRRITQLSGGSRPSEISATLHLAGKPFEGLQGASLAIIEYGDLECPFCGIYQREVYPKIMQAYVASGRARYYFENFPLPMHPHAEGAAIATSCAGNKAVELRRKLLSDQGHLDENELVRRAGEVGLNVTAFSECLKDTNSRERLAGDTSAAQALGIIATPTILLGRIGPNDEVRIEKTIMGAYGFDVFKASIDPLLSSAFPCLPNQRRKWTEELSEILRAHR